MFRKSILFFIILCTFVVRGSAQYSLFDSWSVGVNAGLYGFGVQGATSLSPNFRLRAGVDYFTYTDKEAREFDVSVQYSGYQANTQARLRDTKITFPNFKTMVDFYPMSTAVFSITAGFYFGNNNASTNGMIDGYKELVELLGDKPELRYEDIVIIPDNDGSFGGKLEMGNRVKPYIGIGIGRTIPKNRVGFKFDLGMIYQGEYSISSRNINESGKEWFNELTKELDLPFSERLLNWWPMINLSLTYRIR